MAHVLPQTAEREFAPVCRHALHRAWAEREIAARTRTLLRLACMTDNPALRHYYERAGFRHCGDVVVRGRSSSRYERPVAMGLPGR